MPDSIKGMTRSKSDIAINIIRQLEDWRNSNCFYLDDESRESILEVIVRAEELITDYTTPDNSHNEWDEDKRQSWREERAEFRYFVRNTMIALEKGIGMKRIGEPKKEQLADMTLKGRKK